MLDDINQSCSEKVIDVITPANESEHGCQVSMLMLREQETGFETLNKAGVIADWREPKRYQDCTGSFIQ